MLQRTLFWQTRLAAALWRAQAKERGETFHERRFTTLAVWEGGTLKKQKKIIKVILLREEKIVKRSGTCYTFPGVLVFKPIFFPLTRVSLYSRDKAQTTFCNLERSRRHE